MQARSRYVRLADRASQALCAGGACDGAADILGWVSDGADLARCHRHGVAVLIITCPGALGLAIPDGADGGVGRHVQGRRTAESGDSIERLAEVDRIIFDKTGTLTLPELDVVNSASIPPDVFELAGRLALASHHPVAAAVARAADAKSPLAGAVEQPGQGVRAISMAWKSGSAGRPSAAPMGWPMKF